MVDGGGFASFDLGPTECCSTDLFAGCMMVWECIDGSVEVLPSVRSALLSSSPSRDAAAVDGPPTTVPGPIGSLGFLQGRFLRRAESFEGLAMSAQVEGGGGEPHLQAYSTCSNP